MTQIDRLRTGALAAALLCLTAPAAMADWTEDILDERCSAESTAEISSAVRDAVEASVRRAEASIRAPSSVGDLACLDDLMTQPLAIFSDMGGILDDLRSGMQNLTAGVDLSLDIDVSGMICAFAAEKWATLSEPLSDAGITLANFSEMPSNAASRISSNISLGGSSLGSGVSGGDRVDRTGYSGRISDYPERNTDPMVDSPIYPDYGAGAAFDTAAMQEERYIYQNRVMEEFAGYIGCRVSRNLDGTRITGTRNSGRVNTPAIAEDCTFSPGIGPIWNYD